MPTRKEARTPTDVCRKCGGTYDAATDPIMRQHVFTPPHVAWRAAEDAETRERNDLNFIATMERLALEEAEERGVPVEQVKAEDRVKFGDDPRGGWDANGVYVLPERACDPFVSDAGERYVAR